MHQLHRLRDPTPTSALSIEHTFMTQLWMSSSTT